MTYALYVSEDIGLAELQSVNACYVGSVEEIRDGQPVPANQRITQRWAELVRYAEGWAFPVPPGNLAALCVNAVFVSTVLPLEEGV